MAEDEPVEVCSCEEALELRAQLADQRRLHDTDAETCREALDRVDELTRRVSELEDLGYAGVLKLATAYTDLFAVEARLREAVAMLRTYMRDWGDWSSQEMYGEAVHDGWEEQDRDRLFAHHERLWAFINSQPAAPARTEAEQRVLDACSAVRISTDAVGCEDGRPRFLDSTLDIAAAELARRGVG